MHRKFVTESELLDGFSDSQIEQLIDHTTIFMPMNYCPSPCNICALGANKIPGLSMDYPLIKHFIVNFPAAFNRNHPGEHANDQLGWYGSKGEDYSDILGLYRDHLDYYPRVWTGFPWGSPQVLEKILEMNFVSENHPHTDPNAQLVVPAISRHITNRRLVDRHLDSLEASDRFVEKIKCKQDGIPEELDRISYFLRTSKGVRELRIREVRVLPIGNAEKFLGNPGIDNKGTYYGATNKSGVAVLPTGFYHYQGRGNYLYQDILKARITPQNFFVPEVKKDKSKLIKDPETGKFNSVPFDIYAFR